VVLGKGQADRVLGRNDQPGSLDHGTPDIQGPAIAVTKSVTRVRERDPSVAGSSPAGPTSSEATFRLQPIQTPVLADGQGRPNSEAGAKHATMSTQSAAGGKMTDRRRRDEVRLASPGQSADGAGSTPASSIPVSRCGSQRRTPTAACSYPISGGDSRCGSFNTTTRAAHRSQSMPSDDSSRSTRLTSCVQARPPRSTPS
jgi:hypothetical protein